MTMTRNEKILLISVITCLHRIDDYMKEDIAFSKAVINELKTAQTYLKKVHSFYDDKFGEVTFEKGDIAGMKNRLHKQYRMTVSAKEIQVSSDKELNDLSIINLALCQIEEALECMKKLDKEVVKSLKYARTYLNKFINYVVEVAS